MDLDIAIADLEAKRAQFEAQLDSLRRERFGGSQASLEVPHVRDSLVAVEQQLREKQADVKHLQLVAPIDGVVIPSANVPEPHDEDNERLPNWSGSPMDQKNVGAFFKGGVPFCQIGDLRRLQAALVIDQSDIDLVTAGTKDSGSPVAVNVDELPSTNFATYIAEIAKIDLKNTPQGFSHKTGGELQTRTDASGVEHPLSASYQAIAPLDDTSGMLVVGLRGAAKCHRPNGSASAAALGGGSARLSTSACDCGGEAAAFCPPLGPFPPGKSGRFPAASSGNSRGGLITFRSPCLRASLQYGAEHSTSARSFVFLTHISFALGGSTSPAMAIAASSSSRSVSKWSGNIEVCTCPLARPLIQVASRSAWRHQGRLAEVGQSRSVRDFHASRAIARAR